MQRTVMRTVMRSSARPLIRACADGMVRVATLLVMLSAMTRTAWSQATAVRTADRPWSVRTAEAVMTSHPVVHEKWDYTAGLVLTAIERVALARNDARMLAYVRDNIDRLVATDGQVTSYRTDDFNLDQIAEGRLLFGLYQRTGDNRYRKAAETLRGQLRRQPRTSEGGFWHKQIYPGQMWLDGLYMAEPFYAQFARDFSEPSAFDDITKQFLLSARHLRDARTGLMYHAWDESHKQQWADSATGLSPNFWGRAVGWYAVATVDVLDYLPVTHKDRATLIRVLQELAVAVERVQDPVTGLWYQVLDQPNRPGNYLESSASAMFAYAFAKGARLRYLDAHYRAVAQRAFDGLLANKVTVDAKGMVSLAGVCQVAGLGGSARRDGSFAYYISEPVVADDYKGVGPFIMAALELGQ